MKKHDNHEKIKESKIEPSAITTHAIKEPYQVNVLSTATAELTTGPDLDKRQKDLATIWDLFNTFVAGFTLAQECAEAKTVHVNSGPIGTGDFHNNAYLVYILRVPAARFVGISQLVLFGYGDKEKTANGLLKTLNDEDKSIKTVFNLLLLKAVSKLTIPKNP